MATPNKVSPSIRRKSTAAETLPSEDGSAHRNRPGATINSSASISGKLRNREPRAETPKVSPRNTETLAKRKSDPARSAECVEPQSLERNGDKAQAQPNGDAPENVNPSSGGDSAIDKFIDYRVNIDNSTVDIKAKWESGETTWESEWSLQEQVPTLIFKYWETLGGREAATNLDIYHVFRVLKRITLPGKSKGASYQVQWVGYRQAESTLEQESKLRMIAPGELERFEARQLVKRKSTRGPGRPRKKPRGQK
ncbi:hypothetical protein FPRO04_14639 [Fusarium proliferatum]|nr:hypothetical protein FPRO04_14639 [Fusarium proliferatum]